MSRRRTFHGVYIAWSNHLQKIGCSSDVSERMRYLDGFLPHGCDLLVQWPSDDRYRDESALHQLFKPYRKNGEWFDIPEQVLRYIIKAETIEDALARSQQVMGRHA